MPEREKPITPSPAELWLEKKSENVTFINRDEMSRRLHEIIKPEKPVEAARNFFPLLLEHSGKTVPVSRVPAVIIDAIRQYMGDDKMNIRHFASEHVPRIINAMIADPRAQKRAQEFLADALNG